MSLKIVQRLGISAILAVSMHCFPCYAMNVVVTDSGTTEPIVELKGVIEEGDTAKLQHQLRQVKHWPLRTDHRIVEMVVFINSDGGNIAEALKLGRFLRSKNAQVWTDNICASSCVFVLASGIVRSGSAPIVIHRPYSAEVSQQPLPGVLRKLQNELMLYVDEMNVPRRLVDLIFSVASEDARTLSKDEIAEFRLGQMDMDYAEEIATYNARMSNLSRAEYMKKLRSYYAAADRCNNGRKSAEDLASCFRVALRNSGLRGDFDKL